MRPIDLESPAWGQGESCVGTGLFVFEYTAQSAQFSE